NDHGENSDEGDRTRPSFEGHRFFLSFAYFVNPAGTAAESTRGTLEAGYRPMPRIMGYLIPPYGAAPHRGNVRIPISHANGGVPDDGRQSASHPAAGGIPDRVSHHPRRVLDALDQNRQLPLGAGRRRSDPGE